LLKFFLAKNSVSTRFIAVIWILFDINFFFHFQINLGLDVLNSIILKPEKLNFPASKKLTQFNVIDASFVTQSDGSTAVEIVLKRIVMYHLTNTFMPTSSLLV
jgi:hypothetical protein